MIYGYELIVDLKECKNISRSSLEKFVIELCRLIEMKRWGKCHIVYFGKDKFKGFSLMQFITTSSILGHFTKTEAYINIFSCKEFNKFKVISFIKNWLNTDNIKYSLRRR